MNKTPVFVCDDDEAVCDAMLMLLASVGISTQPFSNAEAVLEALEDDQQILPCCVVADVRMPGMGGIALHERMAETYPQIPVIIVTGHADVPMAVERMKAGASDFLSKPFRDQELIDAVRRCMAPASDEVAPNSTASHSASNVEWAESLAALTPREQEVLALLCEAKTNKVIASDLAISTRTLDIHRARVFEKMQVKNISELLLKMPR